ncbi:MAG TPA: hypothetical protein VI341_13860 [Actinomycetota bacterium]
MAVAYGTSGQKQPTSDQFRARSGVSCFPGAHSPSGGLYISDVERTCASYGVKIDYGRDHGRITRWTPTQIRTRLRTHLYGAVLLGDYDQLPASIDEQPSFRGDHSGWIHDYRASDDTVCWHDPLADKPKRVRLIAMLRYNQKPGSEVRGYVGWVKLVGLPDTSTGGNMDSFAIPEKPSVAMARAGAVLYKESTFKTKAVTLSKATSVRYVGHLDGGSIHIVGWDQSPDIDGKSTLFAKEGDVSGITPAISSAALK